MSKVGSSLPLLSVLDDIGHQDKWYTLYAVSEVEKADWLQALKDAKERKL
jgi:hypothetical protein